MLKRFIAVINVFLLGLVILIFLNIISTFRKEKVNLDEAFASIVIPKDSSSEKRPERNYKYYANNILRRNLFSSEPGAIPKKSSNLKATSSIPKTNLPKTKLNLLLKGTIAAGTYGSFAIIEGPPGRKQGLYKVGDSILEAEIIAIYRKRVVLKRNGREEALFLYDEDQPLGLFVPKEERPDYRNVGAYCNTPLRSSPERNRREEGAIIISKGDADSLVNTAKQILNEQVMPSNFVSEKSQGYRISNFKEDSPLAKLDVREGDVIKEVNGIPLDSPAKIAQAYFSSRGTGRFEVTVERQGKRKTLKYDVR